MKSRTWMALVCLFAALALPVGMAEQANSSQDHKSNGPPFPAEGGSRWQISAGGGIYGLGSNNGHELFCKTTDWSMIL
jgi:hypothetical protein